MVFQIDLRRANNTEIMLTKVKMPLPDMMVSSSTYFTWVKVMTGYPFIVWW